MRLARALEENAADRDARAVQLSRMARARLVDLVTEQGGVWILGGPPTWDKDELVTELLRTEFGQDAHA